MFEWLEQELEQRKADKLYRTCLQVDAVRDGQIQVEGQWLLDLASNNYLGLTQHPRVRQAAIEAIESFGTGAGSARLIGGTSQIHEALENALASLKQSEDALVFSTGYMANIGILQALVNQDDLILVDRLAHASLVDAARLSDATLRVFPHGDMQALRQRLEERRSKYHRVFILTEGIFSMDGDLTPLDAMLQVAEDLDAIIVLDEAHATGVLGEKGQGSLAHFQLKSERILQMGTLSKALGSLGGYLAGPRIVIDALRNKARTFIYTTGLSPADAAAALAAIAVLQEEPQWYQQLWDNRSFWVEQLEAAGVTCMPSGSPIVPIHVGTSEIALRIAQALLDAGIYAPAIRPPTVPQGTARIRTSVTARHTQEQLQSAAEVFGRVFSKQMVEQT